MLCQGEDLRRARRIFGLVRGDGGKGGVGGGVGFLLLWVADPITLQLTACTLQEAKKIKINNRGILFKASLSCDPHLLTTKKCLCYVVFLRV